MKKRAIIKPVKKDRNFQERNKNIPEDTKEVKPNVVDHLLATAEPDTGKTEKPASDFTKYLDLYKFPTTLPSGKELQIRPLNAGQLKKIFVHQGKEDDLLALSDVFRTLIKGAIVDDINVDELYLKERPFLIVQIRRRTKGDTFEFEYKCEKCKSQSIIHVDLSELKVTPVPEKVNPVVELDDNISVELGFPTLADEHELLSHGIKDETAMALSIIAVSLKSIITPDGAQDRLSLDEKIFFTDEIPNEMYEKLLKWHDDNDFGIELKIDLDCVHCGDKKPTIINADSFFL